METKESLVEEFRRDTILRAARHVIARRGLAEASMQAIATEAGVAKGTLYLYFRDRDELLAHSAAAVFDELLASLRLAIAEPRPLRESLRALLAANREFFEQHREVLSVYGEICAARTEPLTRTTQRGGSRRGQQTQAARYVELLRDLLQGALERGELKPVDPGRVALFLAEGASAVMREALAERRKGSEDMEWIVELLLDGLGTGRVS